MKKKIAIFSTSRADYSHLYWLIEKIKIEKSFNCSLYISGSHLEKKYGYSYLNINRKKINTIKRIKLLHKGDKPEHISNTLSDGIKKFTNVLKKSKPDLVILLGDRFEVLAAAIASTILKIPVAHLNGGESTQGAFDEWIRHSISKISSIHFVANNEYKKRLIQLGENPNTIFNVGGLSSDNVIKTKYVSKNYLIKKLNLLFNNKNVLVTYHPVTLEREKSSVLFKNLMFALNKLNETNVFFTSPNTDTDNYDIYNIIKKNTKKGGNFYFFKNLGRVNYLSLMSYCDAVIGNSSSGILEAPYLNTFTINVGNRQLGRKKFKSVYDVDDDKSKILKKIKFVLNKKKNKSGLNELQNFYGLGRTAENICKILKKHNFNFNLKKKFFDL